MLTDNRACQALRRCSYNVAHGTEPHNLKKVINKKLS